MKRSIKSIAVIALALVFCFSGTIFVFGESGAAAVPISAKVPASDIQVQFNGVNMIFGDAAPRLINDRTMVPFRQIFETIGADVSYEPEDRTVQAIGEDFKLSFAVGGTDINIERDGEATVKKMDVVPFIDKKTSRVYVPVRFMAESMDCGVFWDQNSKTAIIIDPYSIFGDVDNDFSIIAKLLYSGDPDVDKAYESKGTFKAEFMQQIPGLGDLNYAISGDIDGIQQNNNADLKMNLRFNVDKMMEAIPPEEAAMLAPLLDMFKDIQMNIKMDAKSGDMFINSNMYAILDPGTDVNTWYQMNLFNVYDDMGMDIRPLMKLDNADQSLYPLLETCLFAMSEIDKDSYGDFKLGYALMKNLIGDEAFAISKRGVITTYSLKVDSRHVLNAIAKVKDFEWADKVRLEDLEEAVKDAEIRADIVIKDKAEKFYSYYLNCGYSLEDIEMSFLVQGDMMNVDLEMSIKQPDVMVMDINVTSNYSETTKTPDLSLPEGAVIKTMDLLQGF